MNNRELYFFLSQFIKENKKEIFQRVVDMRTRHITVVLEDIFQPHNASAVVRSAECMGIQDIHIIENQFRYDVNPEVDVGSSKWINLIQYNTYANNTIDCFNTLRENGYRIVGTSPHNESVALPDLQIDQKTALVFGTEKCGMSDLAMGFCDEMVRIPMNGFTESYNISVSVALCLYDVTQRLFNSNIPWQLSEEEKIDILANWAKKTVNRPEIYEEEFRELRERITQ